MVDTFVNGVEAEVEVEVGFLIAGIAILSPAEIDFLNGKQSTASTCQNRSLAPAKLPMGNFPEPLGRHRGRRTPLWG